MGRFKICSREPPRLLVGHDFTKKSMDDISIVRRTAGSTLKQHEDRNSRRHFLAPTEFVASNGQVYELQPFALPPPVELGAAGKEAQQGGSRHPGHERKPKGKNNKGNFRALFSGTTGAKNNKSAFQALPTPGAPGEDDANSRHQRWFLYDRASLPPVSIFQFLATDLYSASTPGKVEDSVQSAPVPRSCQPS